MVLNDKRERDYGDDKKLSSKEVKKQRRASRPHAEIVDQGKKIWAKLRTKKGDKEDRIKYVDQLMELFKDKMYEVS